ncbi:MAG: hypothetical protein V7754_12025 [Halioglobus sp.]
MMKKHYLPLTLLILAALVGATVAFTFYVDPYGLYRPVTTESLSRINQLKHMRSTKPLKLTSMKPRRIVIGSSRSGRIPVQNPPWSEDAYNLSIPAIRPYEINRLLKFAHLQTPLEEVVIGLDYDAFLSGQPKFREGFNDTLVNSSRFSAVLPHLEARSRTLLSSKSLLNSYQALSPRSDKYSAFLADGSWHSNSPAFSGMGGFQFAAKTFLNAHSGSKQPDLELEQFRELLNFCHSQQIRCHLLLTPVHLFQLEVFEAAGLFEQWETWHRQLIEINTSVARQHRRPPLTLWALNTAQGIVDEPIRKASEAEDSWFKDGTHFRPRLGAMMLGEISHPGRIQSPITVSLSQENVAAYLQQVASLRGDFQQSQSKIIAKLKGRLGI